MSKTAKKTILILLVVIMGLSIPFLSACPGRNRELLFEVTFSANGGTGAPARITGIAPGSIINRPEANLRREPESGVYFEFTGRWYTDSLTTTVWDFEKDTVNANITLYAGWNAVIDAEAAIRLVIAAQAFYDEFRNYEGATELVGWTNFSSGLASASATLNNPYRTQAEIDSAVEHLGNVWASLEGTNEMITSARAILQTFFNTASPLIRNNFFETSWIPFYGARNNAETRLQGALATALKTYIEPLVALNSTMAALRRYERFNPGGWERPATHVELDIFSQLANATDAQTGFFQTVLYDKFNVSAIIANDAGNQFDARILRGFLGDIVVFGSTGEEYQRAINLNMLFDWESFRLLETHGTNLNRHFTRALNANRELNRTFGPEARFNRIYGIGHGISPDPQGHESFFYSWDIRWDLYARLGYPQIRNLDDYIDVLADMKELLRLPGGGWDTDDGAEPFAKSPWPDWDGDMVMNVKSFASSYYGYDEFMMGLFDAYNGIFHDALSGPGDFGHPDNGPYFRALEFFFRLNQRNLLYRGAQTQTWDRMAEQVRNGRTLTSTFDFSGSLLFNTETNLNRGRMMAPLIPDSANVITYGMSQYGGDRVWAIGRQTSHPDRAMMIIDWLASPEGAMTMWYGLRGLHWNYNELGETYFTEFGRQSVTDVATSQIGRTWVSPYTGMTHTLSGDFDSGRLQINNIIWSLDAVNPHSRMEDRFHMDFWRSNIGPAASAIEADWRRVTGFDSKQEYLAATDFAIIPAANFAPRRMPPQLEVILNQVQERVVRFSWQAMMAPNVTAYNRAIRDLITETNALGYAQILEWHRAEAVRRFGAWDGFPDGPRAEARPNFGSPAPVLNRT